MKPLSSGGWTFGMVLTVKYKPCRDVEVSKRLCDVLLAFQDVLV